MTKTGTIKVIGQSSKSHSRPNLEPIEIDSDGPEIHENQWPRVARLSVGGLSQQGRVIREICRDAIRIVEVTLVTIHAWPELHRGTLYKRQVLLEAVNALRANKDGNEGGRDSDYEKVRTRILEDEKFTRSIGKWVRTVNFKVSKVYYIHFPCPLGN
jgi:hypothetical protein